jgi:SAM-dependent methyltransferase
LIIFRSSATPIEGSDLSLTRKRMLNAGSVSGPARRIARMISEQRWEEVRLDIDPEVKPDVVGSITELDLSFSPQSFDAVWSSHLLEHLYAHEVYPALRQFFRVLKPNGFALIMSPNLEAVARYNSKGQSLGEGYRTALSGATPTVKISAPAIVGVANHLEIRDRQNSIRRMIRSCQWHPISIPSILSSAVR